MSYASEQAVLNNQWNAAQEANLTEIARRAPHVLMRPRLSADGTMWMALYGANLQEGVAGFGVTPAAAMEAFDKAWVSLATPDAIRGFVEAMASNAGDCQDCLGTGRGDVIDTEVKCVTCGGTGRAALADDRATPPAERLP